MVNGKSGFVYSPFTTYYSPSFELRFALVDVGVKALPGVFGLEELLLKLSFEREALLQCHFRAGLDAALDAPDGARGLVRSRELPRVAHHLFHERIARVRDKEPI